MSEPRTVVFEETGEKRIVKSNCLRCFPNRQLPRSEQFIVSPGGMAHAGRDDGSTDCGITATGDKWWWPT